VALPAIDPDLLPSLTPAAPKRNLFAAGLSSGVDELQGLLGSAAEFTGRGLGITPLEQYGARVADRNAVEAQQNGRPDLETAPWRQGGAPVLPWLAYQTAKQVPLLGAYLAGTALVPEAAVPAGLARIGAAAPEIIGGGGLRAGASFAARRAALAEGRSFARMATAGELVGLPLAAGSMYQEAKQAHPEGVSGGDLAKIAGLSPFYAALDAVELPLLKGLKNVEGGIVKKVVKGSLIGGAEELVQEGVQTAMEQSFRPDLTPQQRMANIVDGAVTGAAVGSVFGGVASIRRAHPQDISTDELGRVVDQELVQPLGLPAPGAGSVAAPNVRMDVNTAGDVTSTPRQFGVEPDLQAPIGDVRPEAGRVYAGATDPELQSRIAIAENYFAKKKPNEQLTQSEQELANQLQLMQAEATIRGINQPSNNSATNDNVTSPTAGAVERRSDVVEGVAARNSAAPAPATFEDQRTELFKGIAPRTRKLFTDATNMDELDAKLRQELENGRSSKSILALAERRGIDLNEPAKVAAAEPGAQGQTGTATSVETAQATNTEPAAPANLGGGDQTVDADFQAKWQERIKGVKDFGLKELRGVKRLIPNVPANEEQAKLAIYDALGTVDREDKRVDGYKGVEQLAQEYDLVNEDGQLTDEGVRIARMRIPLEDTVKEAVSRGYNGTEASAFDKGARGERKVTLGSIGELQAYNDGKQWALDRNSKTAPIPVTASTQQTENVLEENTAQKGGEHTVTSVGVPEKQKGMQLLNQQIDQVYGSTLRPTENAQLKRMVREGASKGEIDEAARYLASGHGALLQEQPVRAPYRGEKVTKGLINSQRLQQRREDQLRGEVEQKAAEGQRALDSEAAIQRWKRRQAFKAQIQDIFDEVDAENNGAPPELKFRRGEGQPAAGATVDAVKARAAIITHSWKSDVPINVVSDVSELPADVQEAMRKDGATDAYGFMRDGTMHLIASNMPDADTAAAVIYHEGLGHLGLAKMFHKQLDHALVEMYNSNENLRNLVDTWRSHNPDAYNGNLARAVEEVFAEMSERGRVETSLLSKIATILKNFARRMGLKLQFTDGEISAILSMAHDQVINGNQESAAQKGLRYMMSLWHGSPHDFDRFLTTKIGTGEGAQVYGWGLYFSSVQDVAQHYRDMLSTKDMSQKDLRAWVDANRPEGLREDDVKAIARQAKYFLAGTSTWTELSREYREFRREAQEAGDVAGEEYYGKAGAMLYALRDHIHRLPSKGKIYNVSVKAMNDQFLNWDKPLREQSEHVRNALKKLGFEVAPKDELARLAAERNALGRERMAAINAYQRYAQAGETRSAAGQAAIERLNTLNDQWAKADDAYDTAAGSITGEAIYKSIELRQRPSRNPFKNFRSARAESAKKASLALLDVGIRGNIYSDQLSRGGEGGTHNYVVFSHDDVEITNKYKRPSEVNEAARRTVKAVTDVADRIRDTDGVKGKVRKMTLGWMSVHGANEFFGKWFNRLAENGKDVVANGVTAYEGALNAKNAIFARLSLMTTDVLDRFDQLQRTNRDSAEKIVKIMRASEFGINPTRPWKEQSEELRSSKNAANLQRLTNEYHDLYRALLSRGHADVYHDLNRVNDTQMLATLAMSLHQQVDASERGTMPEFSQAPMDAYMADQTTKDFTPQQARDWWARKVDQQVKAVFRHLDELRGERDNPSTDAKTQENLKSRIDPLGKRAADITQAVKALDSAPYFHLGRYGDYIVSWRVNDEEGLAKVADALGDAGFDGVITNGTDKREVFMRVEDTASWRKLHDLVKGFSTDVVDPGSVRARKRTAEDYTAGVDLQWVNNLIAGMKEDSSFGDDEESRKQMIEALEARALDLAPEISITRVLTKRKSIPGYSADMMRSFAWRSQVGINALAGQSVAPKITQAFVDMRGALQDVEASRDAPLNQRDGMRQIIDEYSRRERERSMWPKSKVLDQLSSVATAWFLGFSASYGFVNTTQLGVTLLPELGARHGFANAFGAMAKATPVALKIMREVARHGANVSLDRAMDAVITQDALRKVVGKEMAEFLMRVVNTGNLDIGGPSRELLRAAQGRGDEHLDRVLRYASSIGYYTETASRLIAAIATRQLNPNLSIEAAADRAAYVINETMWNYSQTNQGRNFGKMGVLGQYSPLALKFMQFQAQLTEKLMREGYNAIKGETKAERAEARRYLMGHLSAMTVLAGTLGLPAATVFATVIDRLKDLWDDDDEPSNVRTAYRNWLADAFGVKAGELISHGIFRGAGFDVSQRIGEQDIVPFSRFLADRRDAKDSTKDLAFRTWGAPTSLIAGLVEGGQQMMDGNVAQGLTRMLPNAFAAPVKAYTLTQDGYVDATGKKLPMEPGTFDIMTQLLGFNPAPKAEYSEARQDQAVRKGLLVKQASNLRNQILDAVAQNDNQTARELIAQAQKFDQTNPAFAVLPSLGSTARRRARASALATATQTPLGVSIKDLEGQQLSRYANY
jgi:hypothetical protein